MVTKTEIKGPNPVADAVKRTGKIFGVPLDDAARRVAENEQKKLRQKRLLRVLHGLQSLKTRFAKR